MRCHAHDAKNRIKVGLILLSVGRMNFNTWFVVHVAVATMWDKYV